jgi:hypothetical protein
MAGQWWRRLPATERREYERSERIARLPLRPEAAFAKLVEQLESTLRGEDRAGTELLAQQLVTRICHQLGVLPPQVRVEGRRPHDQGGELHGLYRPSDGTKRDRITVWMRTAKRRDVVAIRTFLRTLLHEVCHHLDTHLLSLPRSFHTPGFYQRESSLFRVITQGTSLAARVRSNRAPASARAPAPEREEPTESESERGGIELLLAAAAAIAARSRRT